MKDRVNSTCQHCKSRYLGCHDECVNYKEFRKKKDEINNAFREGKAKEDLINEYKMNETIKLRKRKGEKSW